MPAAPTRNVRRFIPQSEEALAVPPVPQPRVCGTVAGGLVVMLRRDAPCAEWSHQEDVLIWRPPAHFILAVAHPRSHRGVAHGAACTVGEVSRGASRISRETAVRFCGAGAHIEGTRRTSRAPADGRKAQPDSEGAS
jgi:hypothetical protein